MDLSECEHAMWQHLREKRNREPSTTFYLPSKFLKTKSLNFHSLLGFWLMSNKVLNGMRKTCAIGGSHSKGDGPVDGMTQGSQISRFKLTLKQVNKSDMSFSCVILPMLKPWPVDYHMSYYQAKINN